MSSWLGLFWLMAFARKFDQLGLESDADFG